MMAPTAVIEVEVGTPSRFDTRSVRPAKKRVRSRGVRREPEANAEELVRRDCHALELIGLLPGGKRAAYYEGSMWQLRLIPVAPETSNIISESKGQRIGDRDAFQTFVHENAGAWAWVHPRYRTLLPDADTENE